MQQPNKNKRKFIKEQETEENFQNENVTQLYDQFVKDFVKCLSDTRDPQFYVYNQEQEYKLKNNLISNSVIIYGPNNTGKTSSVMWAVHEQPDVQLILINCQFYHTQMMFVGKMIKEISIRTDQKEMKTSIVIRESIKFQELDEFIINSKKKFVFAIKNCQQLIMYKKQTILYNLCEWMRTDVSNYIGIVYITSKLDFTQGFQKRIKSRMNAKRIDLFRPESKKIIQICKKRLQGLKNNYQKKQLERKSKKKYQSLFHSLDYSVKIRCLQKIFNFIDQNIQFKKQLETSHYKINSKYFQHLRLAVIKDLQYSDFQRLSQSQFNIFFLRKFKEISNYFGSTYENTILQCGIPELIILAVLSNIAVNNRGILKLSQVYKWYLQFQKYQPIIVNFFGKDSKKVMQKNFLKLVEKKIFELQKKDSIWQCEIFLALTAQDIQSCLLSSQQIESFVKKIVSI